MPTAKAVKAMDNRVQLFGTVAEPPAFSHAIGANRLYRCELEVPRLSGVLDRVPLLLPERLETSMRGRVGVLGQLRGYSRQEEGRRRLRLMVLVKALLDGPAEVNNLVELRAQLLRPPTYRKTPMGREIADLLLRAERERGGEDCIPAIVWGGCARYARTLEKGQWLQLQGRIQSRPYMKQLENGSICELIAYELSVNKLRLSQEYVGKTFIK